MEDFEARLRAIPLRGPSPELDGRVEAQKPPAPIRRPPSARNRVPAWLAAAAAVVMGMIGFAAGLAWRDEDNAGLKGAAAAATPVAAPAPIQHIQIIYQAPSNTNPFDFTYASDFFPAGEMEAQITTGEGV
jgi:hypothetical protein